MGFFAKWMSGKSLDQDQLPDLVASLCPPDVGPVVKSGNWSWLEENGNMTFFLSPADPVPLVSRRDVVLAALAKVTNGPWRWFMDGNTIVLKPVQQLNWVKKGISW